MTEVASLVAVVFLVGVLEGAMLVLGRSKWKK